MKEKLTEEIAYRQLSRLFEIKRPLIILGTGTSCAVDKSFGMDALRMHLENQLNRKIARYKLSDIQEHQWHNVLSDFKHSKDFENAMNNIKDEGLLKIIINETASLIADKEKEIAFDIINGDKKWPATNLIKWLVSKRITDRALHIATTNYDCLAEYAFTHADIPYKTGYLYGLCGKYDWDKSCRNFMCYRSVRRGHNIEIDKHVCLYKIHGSLNIFKFNDQIIENNSWMYLDHIPNCIERIMITPGTTKHQKILSKVEILYKEFIDQRQKHDFFLFIGFGFNDNQIINDEISNKLIKQKCPALILTKDINERIKEYLEKCENLWAVYNNYEKESKLESNNVTYVYNCKYEKPLRIDSEFWSADSFCKKILVGG